MCSDVHTNPFGFRYRCDGHEHTYPSGALWQEWLHSEFWSHNFSSHKRPSSEPNKRKSIKTILWSVVIQSKKNPSTHHPDSVSFHRRVGQPECSCHWHYKFDQDVNTRDHWMYNYYWFAVWLLYNSVRHSDRNNPDMNRSVPQAVCTQTNLYTEIHADRIDVLLSHSSKLDAVVRDLALLML